MATESNASNRSEALSKINGLIKNIRIAMLTTAAPDGSLHSRPMATQNSEFTGELWFLTRDDSGKVFDIHHDAHVSLTYSDGKHTYVALTGLGSVSRDQAKINELWNAMYMAWFPQGKEDPEIRVLRVRIDSAEYWDAPSNAVVRNFQILLAAVTAGQSKVGENESVSLR
ncbi:general stress protein [Acidisarcina polymorpha]|uniref:General stress protein n=1 Tax=Acidisarcina polymorpha TaxID=2211140 RepID=A0A2Z5G8G1_9BACT|nr:pyridoxamine 5'-phosphate oxidase family protein [Acidisarcina polymorpha]AXC15238.1 general stress protein [Acidisarcina polymorpha]